MTDHTTALALFPLNLLQVPGLPLQLQVFESRYLHLLEDLTRQRPEDREFGVVAITSGHEVGAENLHGIAGVGCAIRLRQVRSVGPQIELEGVGSWRFAVREMIPGPTPYLRATVVRLADLPVTPAAVAAAGVRLYAALAEFTTAARTPTDQLPDDPQLLAWAVISQGLTNRADQIRLLAENDPVRRIEEVAAWLRQEAGLLQATRSVPFPIDRDPPAN